MSRRVPSCELRPIILSEQYILNMEAFLNIFPLTAFEAQIILEVSRSRTHHIDTKTLAKRIPREFFSGTSNNVEMSVKSLIQRGFLDQYESKKKVLCVRCSKWGRDTARLIISNCFSETLKFFNLEMEKIDARKERLCIDPLGLEIGEKRSANGSMGKIEITIKALLPSAVNYAAGEGRVEYERKVVAEVQCPRCNNITKIEYSFNPVTVWQKSLDIECQRCNLTFALAYSLMKYNENQS